MMPDFLRTPVLASYSAELVAALFVAAVTLSFRHAFPRPDLLSWGAAWAASTAFAGLGFLAHMFPWSPTEVAVLRMVGRSGALLQAMLFLRGAYAASGGQAPAWLRRALYLVPLLATLSVLVPSTGGQGVLELATRAFASVAVGAAALAASALLLRKRPARPLVGTRLMALGLGMYGVLKLFSPMTLGRLGLLQGAFADEALFIGFSLAPSTFALGCVVSLLEDRERVLAGERDRLRVSEEKFAMLFRSSPDAVLLTRPLSGGLIVDVNQSFEGLTGYARSEAIGSTVVELGLVRREVREAVLNEGLATNGVRDRELALRRRDGRERVVSISCEWIQVEGERHALIVARDVTTRRQAEQRLAESEERLRLALDAARMGIWEWDPATGVADWSPRVEEIIGFLPASALAARDQYLEHVHPPDRAALERLTTETLAGVRDGFWHEHRVGGDDGVLRWVEARAKSFTAAEGHRVLRGTVVAIAERKETEEALRLSEERLRRISEAAFEGIAFSEKGRLIDANEQLARMLGYSLDELIGKPVQQLVAPEHRARVADAIGRHETGTYEHRVLKKDGSSLLVEVRARVLQFEDHMLRVTAVRDMSEHAELIERLSRSERLAEVGRLVAGVAHEVRTPLFSISATLDAYEHQLDQPRERQEFLDLLRSQIRRLSGLMSGLLDYGRPPALRLLRGEVASVIERAARSCARLAQEAGVRIETSVGESALFELDRDPDRLEQVFENLLSNAIHHAPRGSVVRVSAEAKRDGEPGLLCTVEDEGPGFRDEDLPRLFEPFFSRRKGGTGLGLAIVRRILEEHRGTVRAANRPGGGAAFSVFLPALREQAA